MVASDCLIRDISLQTYLITSEPKEDNTVTFRDSSPNAPNLHYQHKHAQLFYETVTTYTWQGFKNEHTAR